MVSRVDVWEHMAETPQPVLVGRSHLPRGLGTWVLGLGSVSSECLDLTSRCGGAADLLAPATAHLAACRTDTGMPNAAAPPCSARSPRIPGQGSDLAALRSVPQALDRRDGRVVLRRLDGKGRLISYDHDPLTWTQRSPTRRIWASEATSRTSVRPCVL